MQQIKGYKGPVKTNGSSINYTNIIKQAKVQEQSKVQEPLKDDVKKIQADGCIGIMKHIDGKIERRKF